MENELIQLLEELKTEGTQTAYDELSMTDKGEVRNTLTNLEIIIRYMSWFEDLGFNEFTQEITINRVPFNDSDLNRIRLNIDNSYDLKVPKDDIYTVIETVSHDNTYHPIKEMIESKKWDGVPRVETLFVDYLGAEDNEYIWTITRKWLAGGVARIYKPGTKFEIVPILQGNQGIGKSALSAKLGGAYFTDSLKGLGKNKDDYQQLIGAWIVEIAELASMRATEVELMKNYISAVEDKVRLPYERVPRYFKRTCIFIGTTNDSEYLIDLTGNRRFFPIPLTGTKKHNWTELTEEMVQQVWAEAYQIYKAGEELYLTPEMDAIAERYREDVMERDMTLQIIDTYLEMYVPDDWEGDDLWHKQAHFKEWNTGFEIDKKTIHGKQITKVTKDEILQVAFDINPKDRNQQSIGRKVTLVLDNNPDWEKKSIKLNGKTVRGYKRK